MLRQYVYISTAPGLERTEVDAIIATSEANNAERGITGLLLYNGRNFLQLLEGGESDLIALITRISHDSRHSGISVLHSQDIAERTCPSWAMKRVLIAQSVDERKRLLEAELPAGLVDPVRQTVVNFAVLN